MSTGFSNILTCYLIQSYLLKRFIYYASATDVFLGYLQNFKKSYSKEHQWAAASTLALLLNSDNLLTLEHALSFEIFGNMKVISL